jgi:hypothetical protein
VKKGFFDSSTGRVGARSKAVAAGVEAVKKNGSF